MRAAIPSTEDPPTPIDNPHLREYINDLRRRIEVQNDLLEALAKEAHLYKNEVEKLSLDLAIKNDQVPHIGWKEVTK